MWQVIKFIIRLLALIGIGLVVAGFFAPLHPAFDTLSSLRWHLSVLLLLYCLLLLVASLFKTGFIAMLVAMIGLFYTMPLVQGPDRKTPGAEFSVIDFNLLSSNLKKADVIDNFRRYDPDILILQEVSVAWVPFLDEMADQWPNQLFCPGFGRPGGVSILSKYPFLENSEYCHDSASLGVGILDIDGTDVAVGSVHLDWPWPGGGGFPQVEELREVLENLPENAIIAGDFNASTWTRTLTKFAEYGGLSEDKSISGTWMPGVMGHSLTPLAPFIGLRLDHLLRKGDLKLRELKILPDWGSDHLPQKAEYVIPDKRDDLEADTPQSEEAKPKEELQPKEDRAKEGAPE